MSQTFKNDFAPHVENEELTVDNIIRLLFFGVVKHNDLPKNIQMAIDEEMKKRHG